jgi:hypothetical protein
MKNNRAKSFVTIMVVIAFLAVFLRIAAEKLIDINIDQNESNAEDNLKLVSAALESFAKDHRGLYPVTLSDLTKTSPPYLDKDYTRQASFGYNYSCSRLEAAGYTCLAQPVDCKFSGRAIFSVSTGSILTREECSKKE